MSGRANPTLIGGFVMGGVLLAVTAVVVFGSGQLFRDTRTFISFFDGSVAGLDVGAPVRFRGIEVGAVTEIAVTLPSLERSTDDLRLAVVYDLDQTLLEARGATLRLDDPLDIETLLELGVRAELSTESLVTGRKYIALDLDPANPVDSEPVAGALYPEIPTIGTGLERIEEEVYSIIADLSSVQLGALVNVATETFAEIGTLAGSPELSAAVDRLPEAIDRLNTTVVELQALIVRVDSTLTPMSEGVRRTTEQATSTMQQLEATMGEVEGVLAGVGGALEPESPVFVRFERAMIDLSDASRALRDLADYLERNPSALIRGRPGGGK